MIDYRVIYSSCNLLPYLETWFSVPCSLSSHYKCKHCIIYDLVKWTSLTACRKKLWYIFSCKAVLGKLPAHLCSALCLRSGFLQPCFLKYLPIFLYFYFTYQGTIRWSQGRLLFLTFHLDHGKIIHTSQMIHLLNAERNFFTVMAVVNDKEWFNRSIFVVRAISWDPCI